MKRVVLLILIVACFLGGCSKSDFADVTPPSQAIESIVIQRTNIDEDNNYTYFEKSLSDPAEIEKFCSDLDKLKFVAIDPIKFSSIDYFIYFQGQKSHKLVVLKDAIVYDGLAYKLNKGDPIQKIAALYDELPYDEVKTTTKIFS